MNILERMLRLEVRLKRERKDILLHEDLLWLQKCRNELLKARDNNKKYFHTSTLIRRRRNKVEALLDDHRVSVSEDKNALKDMAVRYDSDLFSTDLEVGGVCEGKIPTH